MSLQKLYEFTEVKKADHLQKTQKLYHAIGINHNCNNLQE